MQPALFQNQGVSKDSSPHADLPGGFAPSVDHPGWIYNKDKRVYMKRGDMSGNLFWLHEDEAIVGSAGRKMLPLHEGDIISDEVRLHVGATAAPGTSGNAAAAAPKHVIIANVH